MEVWQPSVERIRGRQSRETSLELAVLRPVHRVRKSIGVEPLPPTASASSGSQAGMGRDTMGSSQIFAVRSSDALMAFRPSGLKLTAMTQLPWRNGSASLNPVAASHSWGNGVASK
jgi:hypothetical protein